jgi:hypothetical protein
MCLPSRCLAMDVYSGFTIADFWHLVTICPYFNSRWWTDLQHLACEWVWDRHRRQLFSFWDSSLNQLFPISQFKIVDKDDTGCFPLAIFLWATERTVIRSGYVREQQKCIHEKKYWEELVFSFLLIRHWPHTKSKIWGGTRGSKYTRNGNGNTQTLRGDSLRLLTKFGVGAGGTQVDWRTERQQDDLTNFLLIFQNKESACLPASRRYSPGCALASSTTSLHLVLTPHAQRPSWRTRVSLLVWTLPFDLTGMGDPAGS